jgi:glutamate/tyrosine decarboxylase-like PLP-dependent enzyme
MMICGIGPSGPPMARKVIRDSATMATLSAVLTIREHALGGAGPDGDLPGQPVARLYASAETHSPADKAARVDWGLCNQGGGGAVRLHP